MPCKLTPREKRFIKRVKNKALHRLNRLEIRTKGDLKEIKRLKNMLKKKSFM